MLRNKETRRERERERELSPDHTSLIRSLFKGWNHKWTKQQPGFPGGTVIKNPPANAGETWETPDQSLGQEGGGGNGNPL